MLAQQTSYMISQLYFSRSTNVDFNPHGHFTPFFIFYQWLRRSYGWHFFLLLFSSPSSPTKLNAILWEFMQFIFELFCFFHVLHPLLMKWLIPAKTHKFSVDCVHGGHMGILIRFCVLRLLTIITDLSIGRSLDQTAGTAVTVVFVAYKLFYIWNGVGRQRLHCHC